MRDLLIRCNAGSSHGLGHLMRCLSLAAAARETGVGRPVFVLQAPDSIVRRVQSAGFEVIVVPQGRGAWEFLEDLVGRSGTACWLVIDDKYASVDDVARFVGRVGLICYDDQPLREFPADVIINSQPWTKARDYAARPGRLVLAGAAYNSIDSAYFDAARLTDREGVLITMGGEDPRNDIAWVCEHLGDLLRDFALEIVIGPSHPQPQVARVAAERWLPGAMISVAPPSLVESAKRAFLAISAGGTSCYELLAAGVAVVALAVEDHQVPFIRSLEALGVLIRLGDPQPRPVQPARSILERFLADHNRQTECVTRGRRLFSKPGGVAVVRAITGHLG